MSNKPAPATVTPPVVNNNSDDTNVTRQLAAAQKELLEYDKESVKLTQQKYHAYLGMVNASQKDPDIRNAEGKNITELKDEWKQATQARTEGRKAIETKIQQIIDPSLLEKDEERKARLLEIQKQSEAACLEKPDPSQIKNKKAYLEKAIDQVGGQATQPFKESSNFAKQ